MAGLWERRVLGAVGGGTKTSYGTGERRWLREAKGRGYDWFLQGKNVKYDVCCVLYFIDQLAADSALGPDTPSLYWTATKHFLRGQGCQSEALGGVKMHHPLVSKALRSVQVEWSEGGKASGRSIKVKRLAIPPLVVNIARGATVVRVVYVAIVSARGLLLRSCEYVCPANGILSQHLLSWEHISFMLRGVKLVGEAVCRVCADTMVVVHTSRKWQMAGHTREVPDRIRMWHSEDPAKGLWEDTGGCVVAVLQAWCIATRGWSTPSQPICCAGAGDLVLSVKVLNEHLKEWAPTMGLDPVAVASHCLRHGGISDLLDQGVDLEDVRAASGSKSTAAIVPYIHPGKRAALTVSNALVNAVGVLSEV